MRVRLFVSVAVATAMIFVVAPPASASPVVMGLQTVNAAGDSCTDATADYTMDGGLLGCWWIDSITPDPEDPASYTPSGNGMFSGTEHFTGCVNSDGDAVCDPDEPFGTFSTTFTFTTKFDADGRGPWAVQSSDRLGDRGLRGHHGRPELHRRRHDRPRFGHLCRSCEAVEGRTDELGRRLRARLDALGPAPRAEMLHVLMLPDFERVGMIQSYWGYPATRTFGESPIDCEEDRTLRAVVVGMLRERRSQLRTELPE